MEHVVFYPSAEGTPAFRRVPSLEDAVNFVEHLRNSEGTTEFSVHALAEVPLSFRAYYHVEVSGSEPAPFAVVGEPAPVAEAPSPVVEAPAVVEHPMSVEAVAELSAPVAPAPVGEPVPDMLSTPFAAAPPVAAPAAAAEVAEADDVDGPPAEVPLGDSQDVVPVPTGRRSMGFFARS